MKKTRNKFISLLLVAILFIPFGFPSLTADAADFYSPLVITEIFPNPTGTDIVDFMEIMNISTSTVDLYDYATRTLANASGTFDLSKVVRYNYLAEERGQYLLEPGQIAIIFIITGEHYTSGYAAPDGAGGATYDLEGMLNKIVSDFGEDALDLSNAIPVIVDRTLKDEAGTSNADGHGYANSSWYRYWLTKRDETAYNALCWVDVPVANQNNIDYNFTMPTDGMGQMTPLPTGNTPSFGYLVEGQNFEVQNKTPALDSPIAITEIFPNPKGNEVCDFFEIMNISNRPIDLYNYTMWGTTSSFDDLDKVFRHNQFASEPGQYILQPGQIAVIFVITNVHYANGFAEPDGEGGANYDLDGILNRLTTDYGAAALDLSNAITIIADRTEKDEAGTLNADGLGCANSAARYWITRRGDTVHNALCWADVTAATPEGISFNYLLPIDGTIKMRHTSVRYAPTCGYLAAGQSFATQSTRPDYVPASSEIFEYKGFSIRTAAPQGLRVKYLISAEALAATIENDQYKIVEYGAIVTQRESFDRSEGTANANLTLGPGFDARSNTTKIMIWQDGTYHGNIYEQTDEGMIYTAVLIEIKDGNLDKDYAFRAYCIVETDEGERYAVYSATHENSIYDVALVALDDPDSGLSESEIAYIQEQIIDKVEAD